MEHLDELNLLIDKAREVAGSDNKVAQALGIGRMRISNWRHGTQPCPPKQQALLAEIAGLDPLVTLARATVQAEEGTPLGDRLMRALGKASRATGAALGFAGASALAIFSSTPTTSHAARLDPQQHNVYNGKKRYVNIALGRC